MTYNELRKNRALRNLAHVEIARQLEIDVSTIWRLRRFERLPRVYELAFRQLITELTKGEVMPYSVRQSKPIAEKMSEDPETWEAVVYWAQNRLTGFNATSADSGLIERLDFLLERAEVAYNSMPPKEDREYIEQDDGPESA